MEYTQETAETLALQVLAWLVSQEDLLGVFLGSTGASEADLPASAGDPVFLGSVLDFVMMDDLWVKQACDHQGLRYESLMTARQALPGGAQVHWT